MRRPSGLCVVYSSVFLSALGQAGIASAEPATLQQDFNAASEAEDKGDCATALSIFERLASDRRVKPGTLPAATIAVRRGVCLAAGRRDEEAEKQLLAGLPILRDAGATMAVDRSGGEETLGDIAARRRDHDAALEHYRTAVDLLTEAGRLSLYIKLARATQFDGGDQALHYIDQAQKLLDAQSKPDRPSLATVHTIRGRIMMNQGQNKAALAELKQALSLSGGLTQRITLAEVAIRGDLAEAALLNGDKDQARLYLAYTGAGRIQSSPFAVAASMSPPQCGAETGLSPSDSAIVEFGIDQAGDVPMASTVYTRGNYAVATAFARAVESWFWRPADLAKIPPFYKALTRVELRCSMGAGTLPGVMSPLRDRFAQWASPHLDGLDLDDAKVGSSLDKLAILAKARESAGDKPGVVAALTARAYLNPGYGPAVTEDYARALDIAASAHLPRDVYNAILVFRDNAAANQTRSLRRLHFEEPTAALARTQSALSDDALAGDTLTLLATSPSPPDTQRAAAATALTRVADDARLPDHHPLRQVALLRLANLSATAGKLDDAQAFFRRTGLSEEQCSLIGVTPAMRSTGASSNDFPMEAFRFGFEGWVNLEFDINANGTTAHARPVIAYPPFVFVDAATGMARDIRYQASYRPSNAMACSAQRETIRFQIPNSH